MAHAHAHEDEKMWFGFLKPGYMVVWFLLLVLTVVEVIIPEPALIGMMPFDRLFVILSLIVVALAKTVMVAWYYMHLVDEGVSIILIACAPFLFSIFLTIGLFPY